MEIKKKFHSRGRIANTKEMRKKDFTFMGKSKTVENYMINITNRLERMKSREGWSIERKTKRIRRKIMAGT